MSTQIPWPIDSVLTHADLSDEVGGNEELQNLLPTSRDGSSVLDRSAALREVLTALKRRTPPIYAANIADPTDLNRAVLWCTLERLYRFAMTSGSDVFSELHAVHQRKYKSEMIGLQPELNVGVRGNAGSIATSRR